MKAARLTLCLAAAAVISGCAYVPHTETSSRRVSPDYMASGALPDARAYVYGSVTLLEFGQSTPTTLSIRDDSGASVGFERVGRFYRLARLVDSFTVWADGQSVTFTAPMTTRVFSAAIKAAPAAAPVAVDGGAVVKVSRLDEPTTRAGDAAVSALLRLAESQLTEARRLLAAASKNPKTTGRELFDIQTRLDEVERRVTAAAEAIVSVSFPTGGVTFAPTPEVAAVLVASGKAAQRITVRGRTDARKAGPADARIALARALAAQRFLVERGVSPDKISVSSLADGDFAAPASTAQGRAVNRRVELVFFNPRVAELKGSDTRAGAQGRPE